MNTLYYLTAYNHRRNEWWRFAITASSDEAAIRQFTEGYDDLQFSRISARPICTTTDDVFEEL